MDNVSDGYGVVDSMPMISEADGGSIISTVMKKENNAAGHMIIAKERLKAIRPKKSSNPGERGVPDNMAQIITTSAGTHIITAPERDEEEPTQIITASGDTQIFADDEDHIISSGTGQIMTHEINGSGPILCNVKGEILTDETSHIIMNDDGSIATDGSGNILHAGSQVITEDGNAHILSSDGEVIAVDSSLLEGTHELQDHVTEVIEEEKIIEDGPEGHDTLMRRIKKEPEESGAATIQIRVNASSPRKKDNLQSGEEGASQPEAQGDFVAGENSPKYARIDRNDPRSRLHFVKYMKREGKTIKVWECGICGKEFMHQYTLMRHLPTHTDERNFRCNQCGKAFRQMSTLSQHKATHSESRPYVCDVCQKTFSRVSTLISHKKTHTEEKQHRCSVCGKAFHQKGNLKNHLFTHTNERPYKCDICGRGFNQSSNLQCHKAKSHADGSQNYQYIADKYKCIYCDLAFARRAQLRQHEEYKHGVRHSHGSRLMSGTGPRMMVNNALLKKRKIGNVRIIQLPNGDRTFQEIGSNEPLTKQRRVKPKTAQVKNGVLIEPIDTKAMHRALAAGRTPFALLKPCKGVPVVVKVQFALGSKHMLVPASASELRNAGKFTVSIQQAGTKAVQIKVPVVATVIQRIDADGQVHMDIEAPADDEEGQETVELGIGEPMEIKDQKLQSEPGTSINVVENTTEVNQQIVMNPTVVRSSMTEPVMEGEEDHSMDSSMPATDEGIIIGAVEGAEHMGYTMDQDATMASANNEGGEDINSVDLLATAVNLVSQAQISKDGMSGIEGIQYLRQMNLGEYEVVPPDHAQATHIMNQHGQIEQIKMVDENSTVTMEQANISALMDALQNAGYQIGTGNQQIIINADGQAMVVDQQQVQMVIDGDMEGVITSDGVVTDVVDPSSVNLVVHEVPEGIQSSERESGT